MKPEATKDMALPGKVIGWAVRALFSLQPWEEGFHGAEALRETLTHGGGMRGWGAEWVPTRLPSHCLCLQPLSFLFPGSSAKSSVQILGHCSWSAAHAAACNSWSRMDMIWQISSRLVLTLSSFFFFSLSTGT